MNQHSKKPGSAPSHVALAFAAALAASPVVAPAAATLSTPTAQGSATIVPSAAALSQIGQITQSATWLKGPRWIELWPEVTHVEAVRK